MRVQAPHHEEQVWGRGQGFRSGLLLPEKPVSPKCRCPAGTLTRVRISGELLGWLECSVIRARLASEAAKQMGCPEQAWTTGEKRSLPLSSFPAHTRHEEKKTSKRGGVTSYSFCTCNGTRPSPPSMRNSPGTKMIWDHFLSTKRSWKRRESALLRLWLQCTQSFGQTAQTQSAQKRLL